MPSLPLRHLVHQGPVLAALGKTVSRAALARLRPGRGHASGDAGAPQVELAATLPARPRALVDDYVRSVGGDPAWYRGVLPAHFFPQWTFPLAADALGALPYPMWRVVNAGCRLEMRAPLPADAPLQVRATIESIDDDGRRALITQRLVTGTARAPDAVVARVFAFVPLRSASPSDPARAASRKPQPTVPAHARELAFGALPADAGLRYALLSGDVNPVHWVPAYARAAGFRGAILHGFATLARAIEALNRAWFAGDATHLRAIDVRFTRPLVLPARVGVYADAANVHERATPHALWVGDAPGGHAYLEGHFETDPTGGAAHA